MRFLCVCVFVGKECGGRGLFFDQLECFKPNSSIILEKKSILMFMFWNRVCLFKGQLVLGRISGKQRCGCDKFQFQCFERPLLFDFP